MKWWRNVARSVATTGTPMAAYSSSFVLSEYWRYGSGSEGTRPMSAPGQQPGQLVHGHAPVERHAVGGAGLGDRRLDRATPRTVAVDVQTPVELGRQRRQPADGPIQAVDALEVGVVDQAQRAIGHERAARMARRVEQPRIGGVHDDA